MLYVLVICKYEYVLMLYVLVICKYEYVQHQYVLVLTYHDRTVNKRSRHVERAETRGRGTESIDAREEESRGIKTQG
jgi:hypothetical protein